MDHKINLKSYLLRTNAELQRRNAELFEENEALRDESFGKDDMIKELNKQLDCLDRKKSVRFLRTSKVAPGTPKEEDKPIAASSPVQFQRKSCTFKDPLENEQFTGYNHKFLMQKNDANKTKCKRCSGFINKREDMQQCIFCLESFHEACAYVTGKVCMSRGSIQVSVKQK